jgi:hypothetical protein
MPSIESMIPNTTEKDLAERFSSNFGVVPEWLQLALIQKKQINK